MDINRKRISMAEDQSNPSPNSAMKRFRIGIFDVTRSNTFILLLQFFKIGTNYNSNEN